MVKIEVVYCGTATLFHRYLTVETGHTVAQVIEQSGVYLSHPETKSMAVGIFAKQVAMDTPVQSGDRIELYRPLQIDPKENRRKRARQQRS